LKQDNSTGYAALRSGAALVDRSSSGWILMTGVDRRAYLQGLLTNDISALTPGTGCYAAMLTAQGRMITDMRVFELGHAVLLEVPRELSAGIKDHLERFVFSEDVQVEDVTESRAAVGLYGPKAAGVVDAMHAEGAVPHDLHDNTRVRIVGVEAILVRSDAIGVPGFDIVVDAPDAVAIREALASAGVAFAGEDESEAVRIESGMPRFGIDMDADTIPLEAGLEERAISRTKGCYVGQEVIVRVQDRGHGRVAKRLVGLAFSENARVPERGAAISGGGREIGRVTSAAWSPSRGGPIALGYVHRDFVDPGTHVDAGGVPGLVTALPLVPA